MAALTLIILTIFTEFFLLFFIHLIINGPGQNSQKLKISEFCILTSIVIVTLLFNVLMISRIIVSF